MAGAKETPRQKLISLMYLVFITMLALNVSKEVLDGFGQMFEKISDANERVSESNNLQAIENLIEDMVVKGNQYKSFNFDKVVINLMRSMVQDQKRKNATNKNKQCR